MYTNINNVYTSPVDEINYYSFIFTLGHIGYQGFSQGGVWHVGRWSGSGAHASGPGTAAAHHCPARATSGYPSGQADLCWSSRHTSPGEGHSCLCVTQGYGAAAGGQLHGPQLGAGEGPQGLQAAVGGEDRGCEQGSAEAPRRASAPLGHWAATQGAAAPESGLDLPQDFARSQGSSVTGTWKSPYMS